MGALPGEILFDRVLIEELRQAREPEIDFVVREKPMINDATLEDAIAAGMDKV
ncbi:MAG: hypothetical protein DRI26_03705, partial [Chloroflexi bacterium]